MESWDEDQLNSLPDIITNKKSKVMVSSGLWINSELWINGSMEQWINGTMDQLWNTYSKKKNGKQNPQTSKHWDAKVSLVNAQGQCPF